VEDEDFNPPYINIYCRSLGSPYGLPSLLNR
jgi:hypothetical protein